MIRNFLIAFSLLFVMLGCSNSAEGHDHGTETHNTTVSGGTETDPSTPTDMQPETQPESTTFAGSDPGFQAFIDQYTPVTLPRDFPESDPENGKAIMSKPVKSNDLNFICGEGLITCASDEQAFHAWSFPVSENVIGLVTFLAGDFNERFVLSTHRQDGGMVAQMDLATVSEFETFSYAGRINSKNVIIRSTVITPYDEKTKEYRREIDSQEKFKLGEDGSITAKE